MKEIIFQPAISPFIVINGAVQWLMYYFYSNTDMNKTVKKILVVLPVLVLSFFFFKDNYRDEYRQAGARRLVLFSITVLLLFAWITVSILKRTQDSFWQILLQSSFFVYVFMVLTLTGYFILFRELSYQSWWQQMLHRVERRDHVNLQLFKIFSIYKLTDKQIFGNFIMLLPMGVYLPVLYKRLAGFFPVLVSGFLLSVSIELLQLATSFRSADADDVLLNTSGACAGFIFYKTFSLLYQHNVYSKANEMSHNNS